MAAPSRRHRHSETYSRRQREARELGLWPEVTNADAADRRRQELAGLGFHEWESDEWERIVDALRAAKAGRDATTPG
jgi:hypothetical protein